MNKIKNILEQFGISKQTVRLLPFILFISIIVGLLVAFFLWLLDIATKARWQNIWLIFFLPLAGIFITWMYRKFGKNSDAGNNLIMDEIHEPGGGVPARMTPFVLFATVLTHLFGGSAGREGTAVQMGGSIAAFVSKQFSLIHQQKNMLLICGIAAGFGAVFGTPFAGAIFAIEVLVIGKIKYDAFIPCLMASFIAHFTCISCGIQHTHYNITYLDNHFTYFNFNLFLLLKVILIGILFGLVGALFAKLSHTIKRIGIQFIPQKWLIPMIGAALIISISYLLDSFDYLGLGVTNPNTNGVSIISAFHANGATDFSWCWKLLLTAITLGTGFKGGEVTPLFFIGATLGNTLAMHTGSPVDLFAALGFIAVFAAATNTPLACTMMGIELFGVHNILYYFVACFAAFYCSGQTVIYHAQRIHEQKINANKGYFFKKILK
jgi:H+/Cl- antiporter ClcA